MNTTEVEIKAVAKAAGAALARAGHEVPHSVLLHALAAALDKRDWHKLKAGLKGLTREQLAEQLDDERIRHLQTGHTLMARAQDEWLDKLALQHTAAEVAQTLRNVRNYLETPGDLTPDEVGYLLHDVQADLHRLDAAAPVVVKGGNAYRLVNGSLQSCAVLADGRISGHVDANEWYEVSEHDEQSDAARKELASTVQAMKQAAEAAEAARAPAPVAALPSPAPAPEKPVGDVFGDYVRTREAIGIERRMTPSVSASFWTDDHAFEVTFDATPYLAQAVEVDLKAIIEVGYRGDECTDWAAEYLLDHKLDERITEAFDYLHALQKSPMKDPPGFEVEIDREEFLRWMDTHHQGALAEVLCSRADIRLRTQQSSQAAWVWEEFTGDGTVIDESDETFDDSQTAALDAYRKKRLLEMALTGEI